MQVTRQVVPKKEWKKMAARIGWRPVSMAGQIRAAMVLILDRDDGTGVEFDVDDVGVASSNFYMQRQNLDYKKKIRIFMDWDRRKIVIGPYVR